MKISHPFTMFSHSIVSLTRLDDVLLTISTFITTKTIMCKPTSAAKDRMFEGIEIPSPGSF